MTCGRVAIRIMLMDPNLTRILLFDIDGTLLDPLGEGHACMARALDEVFGTAGPIETYDMSGKTDWQIVTELMDQAGIPPKQVDGRLGEVFNAYAKQVALASTGLNLQALPGTGLLLDRLAADSHFLLGLLTGNAAEAVPHKLRAAGLKPAYFRFGAFGSEHRDRNALPAVALERAGQVLGTDIQPHSALVIGDTPRDIDCARHAGLKVLCVATGSYDLASLAAQRPDFLLPDLSDTRLVMDILTAY